MVLQEKIKILTLGRNLLCVPLSILVGQSQAQASFTCLYSDNGFFSWVLDLPKDPVT